MLLNDFVALSFKLLDVLSNEDNVAIVRVTQFEIKTNLKKRRTLNEEEIQVR